MENREGKHADKSDNLLRIKANTRTPEPRTHTSLFNSNLDNWQKNGRTTDLGSQLTGYITHRILEENC